MKTYTRYKKSGVSWIGDVPEQWNCRKFQYLFKERSEKNHPNEPILCATQSRGVIPQSMYENRVVVVNTGFEGLKLVKKGDFVISLRSFQGGIEYAYYQGIISAAYTILRIDTDSLLSDYVRILFKSAAFIGLLKTCVTGIREGQNINNELLRKQLIPIPPLSEQKSIAKYLDDKCAKIDAAIENINKQIDASKRLKRALINEVITGQRAV
jgi:type I restriction enzyme S subunit